MKLKPEIKTAWVEALRSGKYKQDKLYLKTSEGHCCLGVLCEAVLHKKEMPDCNIEIFDNMIKIHTLYDVSVSSFPTDLIKYIALDNPDSFIINGFLPGMNDTDEKSFIEIADWIEQNL